MNARDLAQLLSDRGPVRPNQGGWMACCPAHEDSNPSLSIKDGNEGVVMKCFAGCETEAILAEVGITWSDLFPEEPRLVTSSDLTIYEYRDERGLPLFEVVRGPGKRFRQRVQDSSEPSGYRWSLKGVPRVLYHLPAVVSAVRHGEEVWITEGEKDADAVRAAGKCGTTMPMGAGKWRDEYTPYFENATVTIWADADEAGRKHAREVRDHLQSVAAAVRIVESAHGKDASDHLGHGLGLDDVLVTMPYEQPDTEALFMRWQEFCDADRPVDPWVIPTILRRGEVLMLTGFEGMGKSALMKQFAAAAALGVHPFHTVVRKDPARVLYIDCENPEQDCAEDFTRLRAAAQADGTWRDDADLFIRAREELDLGRAADMAWLIERVNAHQPDLLVIGPLYGLMGEDLSASDPAFALKRGISTVQGVCNCAVILEHHSPQRAAGEDRAIRPYGNSVLMRWPSFGFGLMPTDLQDASKPFQFQPWRGPRRRGRSWPKWIKQANNWFWEEAEPPE